MQLPESLRHMIRKILAAFVVLLLFVFMPSCALAVQSGQGPGQGMRMRGDFDWYYTVKAVLSTVNLALLVVLLAICVGVYLDTRSEFALGLLIFAVAMMMYAVTSNPWMQSAFGFRAYGLGPFAFFPDLFALTALVILLFYAIRYR
jgi:ABC-type Fe3+ transport system permease subunit